MLASEENMRQITMTVEQHSNGALSLWIHDEAFGNSGRHRGGYELAENLDHASFYRSVAHSIARYAAGGDKVTFIDRNN